VSASVASLSLLPYLAGAYTMALTPSVAIAGRLSDIFGRGPLLAVSLVGFGLANLLCGLAPEGTGGIAGASALLVGRAISGVCAGPMLITSLTVAGDLLPQRQRGLVYGLTAVGWSISVMAGAYMGGWINDVWGWRWAFIWQTPASFVFAALVWLVVRLPPKVSSDGRGYLARIDWTGAALVVATLLLFQLPLNAGGTIVAWSHPLLWASFILSAVSLVALVRVEAATSTPILPLNLLADPTVLSACVASALSIFIYCVLIFYAALYFEVRGRSAAESGLRIMTIALGQCVGGGLSGVLISRTGRYKPVGIVASALTALGAAVLLLPTVYLPADTIDETTADALACLGLFVVGLGIGPIGNVTTLAAVAAIDSAAHQSLLATATQLFREIGASLGAALPAAVFQNVLRGRLWDQFGDRPGAADLIDRILDDVLRGDVPDGWEGGAVARSFMVAFAWVWVMCLASGLLESGCVVAMREFRLRTERGK
jgi:MFS family permease